METALALAVVSRAGTGTVALLEYLVGGQWRPVFDEVLADRCYPPDDGWVF